MPGGSAPFLSVVTRTCPGRGELLARNRAALDAQTDPDWEQVVITDPVGRGLRWANCALAQEADRVHGEWVWILDDDDYCADPDLVADLKRVVAERRADVVLVKMDRKPFQSVLPDAEVWGKQPVLGHIGAPCVLVRNRLWKRHIDRFCADRAGDYRFIKALFDAGYPRYWWDRVCSVIDRIGGGRVDKKANTSTELYAQLSVLIVNYKTKALLNEALCSLMQHYPKIPILIIDNNSADASVRYLQMLPHLQPSVSVIFNDRNIGHGLAMDQGLRHLTTPYVFTLDTDCVVRRGGFLEDMVVRFQADPALYALGWKRRLDRKTGVPHEGRERARQAGKFMDYIHPHAMLIDRDKYVSLPPFVHHGNPGYLNMAAAQDGGLHLEAYPIGDYVEHLVAGTRRMFGGAWNPGATVEPQPWNPEAVYPI